MRTLIKSLSILCVFLVFGGGITLISGLVFPAAYYTFIHQGFNLVNFALLSLITGTLICFLIFAIVIINGILNWDN